MGKVRVKVSFESNKIVKTKNNVFVRKGFCDQGLFMLSISEAMNGNSSSYAHLVDTYDVWHARLGHVNSGYIKKMQSLGLINNIDYSCLSKCQICATSKLTKRTCGSVSRETNLLELVHYDLGDLKQTMTRGGKKFYVTFIDNYSRFIRIYLLRHKDETFDMFLSYKAEVENQLDRKNKRIIFDRGGEYTPLNDYCEREGIIYEVTPPYSPESNGVAKRKNMNLQEMLNSLLISASALNNLWREAILSACHLHNRIPYNKTGQTPYELWKGHAPNLKYLKVWGCLDKIMLPDPKKRKPGSKTYDCMFIGYASNSVAYRFLVLKSDVLERNTIIETKNAEFF